MTTTAKPPDAERVACEICLKEIPRSEAMVGEATDYVAHFCGLECYERWKAEPKASRRLVKARPPQQAEAPAAAPEPEIQLGDGRSPGRDEQTKKLIKRHPQRDEPRIDSVEPDEIPRP